MEKRFKAGLVVGKFMPFHKGHQYLIDTAFENCDKVYVLVCHTPEEPIDGQKRFNMVNEHYQFKDDVIVKSVDTSHLPQYESDCDTLDEFYAPWIPFVAEHAPDIDSVFTSEAYGDDFARYLGVEHYLVDKERTKYPISGTEVRGNLFGKWDMLPDSTKREMQLKIAILGTESTGKSTLCTKLSRFITSYANISTSQMYEYGRTYVEKELVGELDANDFDTIATRHNNMYRLTNLIGDPVKIQFVDTEAVITNAFAQLYLGEDFQSDIIDTIISKQDFDMYLLMDIDVPWVDDGTREFPHKREEHFNLIKKNLEHYGIDYQVVSGDYYERFEKVLKKVDEKLALSKSLLYICSVERNNDKRFFENLGV